jgi:hypothetical protein
MTEEVAGNRRNLNNNCFIMRVFTIYCDREECRLGGTCRTNLIVEKLIQNYNRGSKRKYYLEDLYVDGSKAKKVNLSLCLTN